MKEKKQTATHARVRGKSTSGKADGKTARADVSTGRARGKTAAKATAQKRRPAGENRRKGLGKPADVLRANRTVDSRPAKRGLARLEEEARNVVEKDAKHLLKGLKTKALRGSASDIKLLFDLAKPRDQKRTASPDDESLASVLRDLAVQPEYREPAKDADDDTDDAAGSQPAGFRETPATVDEQLNVMKKNLP